MLGHSVPIKTLPFRYFDRILEALCVEWRITTPHFASFQSEKMKRYAPSRHRTFIFSDLQSHSCVLAPFLICIQLFFLPFFYRNGIRGRMKAAVHDLLKQYYQVESNFQLGDYTLLLFSYLLKSYSRYQSKENENISFPRVGINNVQYRYIYVENNVI